MLSIPGFKILRPLNQGGFGHVHLAQRLADGAKAAIKVLHLPNDDNVRRFYREAKLLHQQIGNPYIVSLFAADFQHSPQYIAMEYCAGGSLRDWVGQNVDWLEIVFALSHAAAGLAKIHEVGGFHRDIKPDNLLVSLGQDGVKLIKVGDFGLARVPHTSSWPMTTSPAGTRGYMAPELWRGAPYDAPCDVYSLGITGIELLTGGLTPQGLLSRSDIPSQLRALLLSMVHQEPARRPNILMCHQVLVKVGEEEYLKRKAHADAARAAQEQEALRREQRERDERARQTRERDAREREARERRAQDQQAREQARAQQQARERQAVAGAGLGLGGIAALLVGGIALATMNSRDENGRWRGRDGRFRSGRWG